MWDGGTLYAVRGNDAEWKTGRKIEGKLEGNTEGKQEFLLTALESKFSVPSELKEKIMSETDIEKLELWFQLSLKVSSLEEFEQNMWKWSIS